MDGEGGTRQPGPTSPTPAKRLFACGVGNFYNDLVCKVMYSFGLVYYMKVIELTSFQAGLVLVMGELACFIANIIFGYLCDVVDVPFLSRRIGRRKSWHVIGTALVAVSVMLSFSRCFPCQSSPASWVAFVYFTLMYSTACFAYGAVELSHLTIIPEVSQSDDETVMLNSIRSVKVLHFLSTCKLQFYGGSSFVKLLFSPLEKMIHVALRHRAIDYIYQRHIIYYHTHIISLGGIAKGASRIHCWVRALCTLDWVSDKI